MEQVIAKWEIVEELPAVLHVAIDENNLLGDRRLKYSEVNIRDNKFFRLE